MPAHLARRYDEPVAVERRDDVPAAFVWRGRRHVVQAVLDHWSRTGPWWQHDIGAVADDEREFWRVEARAAGRSPVVVDLCFAWTCGGWTVASVLD